MGHFTGRVGSRRRSLATTPNKILLIFFLGCKVDRPAVKSSKVLAKLIKKNFLTRVWTFNANLLRHPLICWQLDNTELPRSEKCWSWSKDFGRFMFRPKIFTIRCSFKHSSWILMIRRFKKHFFWQTWNMRSIRSTYNDIIVKWGFFLNEIINFSCSRTINQITVFFGWLKRKREKKSFRFFQCQVKKQQGVLYVCKCCFGSVI